MAGYKKCPRCELNWILSEEEYCDVCKAELNLGPKIDIDLDFGDEEDEKICPICKRNYIKIDEEMCEQCAEERENEIVPDDIDLDKDEEWRNYLDEDEKDAISSADDGDEISLSQLAEDEKKEMFGDEEDEEEDDEEEFFDNKSNDEDDFEIPEEIDMRDFEEEDDEEDEKVDDDF